MPTRARNDSSRAESSRARAAYYADIDMYQQVVNALVAESERFRGQIANLMTTGAATAVAEATTSTTATNPRETNRILLPIRDIDVLIGFFDRAKASGIEPTPEEQSTVKSLRVARGKPEDVPDETSSSDSKSPPVVGEGEEAAARQVAAGWPAGRAESASECGNCYPHERSTDEHIRAVMRDIFVHFYLSPRYRFFFVVVVVCLGRLAVDALLRDVENIID
jgi:hypothetical protein